MLPNALATTLALALAIPGGVFAVDAVNDDTVPGVSTSDFFRERGAALGIGQGHDRHDQAHGKHHPGAHDRAHGNHTYDTNGTHDRRGPHHGTDHASHRGHPGAHLVARCLTDEDNTTQDCIDLAGRIANVTVERVAQCMESDEPRSCYGKEGRHHASFVGRIAHCIDENGQVYCADKLATHLVCHGAHIAGVESPIECPEHDHPYPEKQQTTAHSDDSDDADTTTSSDQA